MELIEVKNSSDAIRFHKVPFFIYKDDSNWIPQVRQLVEKKFHPESNKLLKEGGSVIRWILSREGRDIGRVAAFVNPRTARTTEQHTGGMGFFDCINDQDAADMLFTACVEWLKSQGMEAMDGPVNFGDRNEYWGLQVDSFDKEIIYPMNYNPPYYQMLFENYGFKVYFEQYIFWRTVSEPAQEVFYRKYNQIKDDLKIRFSNIKGRKLEEVAEEFRTVYNEAWVSHNHFRPMSEEAAQKLFNGLKRVYDPEIVIFAHYDNKPVAFYLNLPELNQIFRHIHGNLNWIGKLKVAWHKYRRTCNRMTGIIFGVVPQWQGKGLEAGMIVFGERTIGKKGRYKDTVLSWIGDFNPKMIKVAQNLGTSLYMTFYTYRYLFDRDKEFKRCPIIE